MRRLNFSITSKLESQVLNKLVVLLPGWVTPDILTGLALTSAVVGFVLYLKAFANINLLWGVNICLLVHWFADSLDGKLARLRKDERPRYGYYVDHLLDTVSAALFIGGINSSALTLTAAWEWVLVLILISMVHVFLKTKVTGVFELSLGVMGPTESRLLLILANCLILFFGNVYMVILGLPMTLFDLLGWIGVVSFMVILVPQVMKTIFVLNKEDRSAKKIHKV